MSKFDMNSVTTHGNTHFGDTHVGDSYNVHDMHDVNGGLIIGKNNTIKNTKTMTKTINYFQGELSNLADDLQQAGYKEDSEYIEI